MIPKYRAWIPAERKMIQVDGLSLLNGYVTSEWAQQTWSIHTVTLIQFTGLMDKDGKDGYAGDIVKLFNRSLFVIVWDDYYARFQLELVKGDEHRSIWDMGMLQFGEIVGTIFETPELASQTS